MIFAFPQTYLCRSRKNILDSLPGKPNNSVTLKTKQKTYSIVQQFYIFKLTNFTFL